MGDRLMNHFADIKRNASIRPVCMHEQKCDETMMPARSITGLLVILTEPKHSQTFSNRTS